MILVTGATGTVGRELVPQLVNAGARVRVLTRDRAKAHFDNDSVDVAVGNLNECDSLVSAMTGVESVYLIAFEAAQVRNAVNAACRAGVRRIVRQSTIEAGFIPPLGPGKWHREQERIVETSGLSWTHIRPTMMMSNTVEWWASAIATQGAVYFPGGSGGVSPVDPYDIARVATHVLLGDGRHDGRAYDVTGGEVLTIGDMVAILGRALRRPLHYVDVPEAAAGEWMRKYLPPYVVEGLLETLAGLRAGRFAYVSDTVTRLTGEKPRTFEEWSRDHAPLFATEKPQQATA